MNGKKKQLFEDLVFLYGNDDAKIAYDQMLRMIDVFREQHPELSQTVRENRISERDAILITYADMVQQRGKSNLASLDEFLTHHVQDSISTVHILPFFPYSSDDGFAVIDYEEVNPAFGSWDDIDRLGDDFRLMFDAVINHISSQSEWFKGFLRGELPYREFFTVIEPGTDLSMVFRPRSSPILTPVETVDGEKLVWTTFGPDQIDLNYRDPRLLQRVMGVLLFYVAHGAEFIRLDAVTFIWKQLGTPSINMPETHRIIQLLRTVLDIVAPRVTLITETNVPHKDNISYFGDGTNEAQMVYNFALPLLTIHAFLTGNAQTLSKWADTLELPSDQTTFFNFLAGHDGIGMLPVRDILDGSDIEMLVEQTLVKGGNVSYKSNSDGSLSPYELNINYLDMLGQSGVNESPERICNRFLTSQAIMLALRGVPGIYFHSLFGSRNWLEGVEKTERYRTINREKMDRTILEAELDDPNTLRHKIFHGYHRLLQIRGENSAFHPNAGQDVWMINDGIFSIFRSSSDIKSHVICLHSVCDQEVSLEFDISGSALRGADRLVDLIGGQSFSSTGGNLKLSLAPYQTLWLSREND